MLEVMGIKYYIKKPYARGVGNPLRFDTLLNFLKTSKTKGKSNLRSLVFACLSLPITSYSKHCFAYNFSHKIILNQPSKN